VSERPVILEGIFQKNVARLPPIRLLARNNFRSALKGSLNKIHQLVCGISCYKKSTVFCLSQT
jgi:hypothetical protein